MEPVRGAVVVVIVALVALVKERSLFSIQKESKTQNTNWTPEPISGMQQLKH